MRKRLKGKSNNGLACLAECGHGVMNNQHPLKRSLGSSICICSFVSIVILNVIFASYAHAYAVSADASSYHHVAKAFLFDRSGDYEQARREYQMALRADPFAWNIRYNLALVLLRLNDFKGAEREFLRLVKERPYDEKSRYFLALVYSFNEQYAKAISQFRALLERPLLEFSKHQIHSSLGYLYLAKGDLAKAQAEYIQVISTYPNSSEAHFYLGFIHSEFSNYNLAIEEFSKAIEFDENNAAALNSLSYLYAERGEKLDEAFTLVTKALRLEPTNGAYLDTLGWVYFKKGDLENAKRYLENASVLVEDPEILDHLGDLYLVLGKTEEAKKSWQKALRLDPERKTVKQKIKGLPRK